MDSRTKKKRATKSHKYTFPINNSEPHANISKESMTFFWSLYFPWLFMLLDAICSEWMNGQFCFKYLKVDFPKWSGKRLSVPPNCCREVIQNKLHTVSLKHHQQGPVLLLFHLLKLTYYFLSLCIVILLYCIVFRTEPCSSVEPFSVTVR